ncbi:putative secreted protein [Alcanivorax hongdengensis A-11-3]|uniref:Putative secreted protein n=1 Tax=Alcanivorax hongdengensis A-11-3 TaxID=1177179 RepID=L0WFN1_9GAMM|nr:DUF1223 domain-containing protein [Alcanivorax hongdengensis]EKF75663.1 putative secreted protein [Alcanivorax hongdengensis A-11-3]
MRTLTILILLSLPALASADTLTFSSGPEQVPLVELYTSQGCSSCPPADALLSRLADEPGLFHDFIPVAFHVDYWDYLGWQDPYARPAFSQRQRDYARTPAVGSVYTPGWVVAGREWRGYFRHPAQWRSQLQHPTVGTLSATLNAAHLRVQFSGELPAHGQLHLAWLGNGLSTPVAGGENGGRTLRNDFVVLYSQALPFDGETSLTLPPVPQRDQQRTALVLWVSPTDSPIPIQATGGYLPDH